MALDPTPSLLLPTPVLAAENPIIHVVPHELFSIGPIYFTNFMVMTFVAAALLLLVALGLKKQMATTARNGYVVRGRGMQLFETLAVFVREEIARPNLGELTDRYIGYLWTCFFFIFFANVLGLIPFGPLAAIIAYFVGGDAYSMSYWGGTATGTLALTVPLAFTAFVAIVGIGLKEAGIGYLKHFNPGPLFMAPLLVPLEVMGLIIKCCVLAMRLFGTMMAGHLVIAVFLSLITMAAAMGAAMAGLVGIGVVLMGFAIMTLELFVAALQAFIFTFLTTLFIAQGAVHHGDHEHEHHDHGDIEHQRSADRHADVHELKAAEQAVVPH